MIKCDNGLIEIDGNGEQILVEFVELSLKISELYCKELDIMQEELLKNLFKTIEFALQSKEK